MATVALNVLKSRIGELELRFVDFDIPLDRLANHDELDRIAAFKLLVHAELEGFIEARVQFAIDEAVRLWDQNRQVTRTLLMMMLRWTTPEELGTLATKDGTLFREQIVRCRRRAEEELETNNGIKLDAFQRMGCSAGFLTDDLLPTLTGAANSYGKDRGDVAHKPRSQVRTLNDPRVEAAAAKALVEELEKFDDQFLVYAGQA